MNLQTMLWEFLQENGTLEVLASAIVDFTYYILAKDGDRAIFAYGGEDCGFQFDMLSEVGEPYRAWFEQALADLNLVLVFNDDKVYDAIEEKA